MLNIRDNQVDIWKFELNSNSADSYLEFSYILSDDELLACNKLIRKQHKQYQLLSKIILRLVISSYINIQPSLITFQYDSFGKPQINFTDFHFNISHSEAMLVIAISNNAIGVDIEKIKDIQNWNEISASFLTQNELSQITQYKIEEQKLLFYSYWTQKEALLKAVGVGLNHHPLNIEIGNKLQIFDLANSVYNFHEFRLTLIFLREDYIGHIAYKKNMPIKVNYYDFCDIAHYKNEATNRGFCK